MNMTEQFLVDEIIYTSVGKFYRGYYRDIRCITSVDSMVNGAYDMPRPGIVHGDRVEIIASPSYYVKVRSSQ